MNRLIKFCISTIMIITCNILAVVQAPSTSASPAPATPAAPVFSKQIGESLRYSIAFPAGWQTKDLGAQVLAWPAPSGKTGQESSSDTAPIKILVTAVELTGSPLADYDLDKLFDASLAEVKKNVTGLNLIMSGKESVNGHQAKSGLMIYQLSLATKPIQQLSYMFKEGKKAYVVECLVNKDKYGQYGDSCKKIIQSFKILEPINNPIEPPKEIKQDDSKG